MITYNKNAKENLNSLNMEGQDSMELENQGTNPPQKEERIPIDGFAQVVDMLRVADQEFRESILKNIERRDPDLAYSIRKTLLGL